MLERVRNFSHINLKHRSFKSLISVTLQRVKLLPQFSSVGLKYFISPNTQTRDVASPLKLPECSK